MHCVCELVRSGAPDILALRGVEVLRLGGHVSVRVRRANAREHISFGTGVHACLGAALARMELHIGLQSLFEHFPQLTLAGEPTFNDSIGLHGLKHLPVSLRAATAIVP